METFWQEVFTDLPDGPHLARIVARLAAAALLGALPGAEREHAWQAAGLRTHMLVSLGSAIFVMTGIELGATPDNLTRIFQGVATGIGFVGAGAIFKQSDRMRTRGLATAASIWLMAAVGSSVGAGRIWLPLCGTIVAWIVLAYFKRFDTHHEADEALP